MNPLTQMGAGSRATPRARYRATGITVRTRFAQAGVGLIELMIVVLISAFMMAGLLTIVYGTRQNFTAQYQLAQLQDNERLAMTLLTNVIQTGGYFWDPSSQTPAAALPANGNFASAGQFLYGTGAGAGADVIYVRYLAGTSDGVTDCTGATNPSTTTAQMDVNYLYVNAATKQLMCQATDGTAATNTQVLVSGVTGMTIYYGVAASGGTSAVQYIPGGSMTAANWTSVVSVQLKLTFVPPATAAGANMFSTMTVPLTRTIDLFNRV
jgi:type IV pilus assembly protein PilW